MRKNEKKRESKSYKLKPKTTQKSAQLRDKSSVKTKKKLVPPSDYGFKPIMTYVINYEKENLLNIRICCCNVSCLSIVKFCSSHLKRSPAIFMLREMKHVLVNNKTNKVA